MSRPRFQLGLIAIVSMLICLNSDGVGAQDVGSAGASNAVAGDFRFQGENYKIGPGDTLEISVWQEPDLSAIVPVRPDGRVTTHLVEDMDAVGKTPTQLADDIEAALALYLRSPVVTVIVQNPVGVMAEQIRVIGQAANARAIPYFNGMTVLDVVIAVGGLTEFAAGNRSKLIRSVDGETKEIRVRLDDLMNKGRLSENLPVQTGDVLSIPESRF